jgi:hypothetical protein
MPRIPEKAKAKKAPRGDTRFPSIVRHAAALECSRVHLFLVLIGERTSPRLLSGYKKLLTQEGRSVPADLRRRAA